MTNFEKLKKAFPSIDTRSDQPRLLCPVTFLGNTFCLKQNANGKGMLTRDVYDPTVKVCIDCANAYWAFDEDDPSLVNISIVQVDPVDIKEAATTHDKVSGVCALYNLGHISLEQLKAKLNPLGFAVTVKKTSFIAFQKQKDVI